LDEGHETPENRPSDSMLPHNGSARVHVTFQAAAPPVGSVEVITLPRSSTATHRDAEGQETLLMRPASTATTVQAVGPPEGFADVTMCPRTPTPTQKDDLKQETPRRAL
jgi:hypothetical protein